MNPLDRKMSELAIAAIKEMYLDPATADEMQAMDDDDSMQFAHYFD